MSVKRKFALLWSFCFILILIAISMRYLKSATLGNDLPQSQNNAPVENSIAEIATTSPEFYTNSTPLSTPNSTTSAKIAVKLGPVISAKAYLVGNLTTGEIYLQKNQKLVLPVASMSKLITAIESLDRLASTTIITITAQEYNVASDTSRISEGEQFTLNEMLYPLLLNSSNVAAEALASSSNRKKFMDMMSSYAWEIGMPNTYFADPSGLSASNISTAKDFFALARYLFKSRSDILSITRTAELDVATTTLHSSHKFISIHPFIKDPEFIGGKTGHTPEAKDTMLTMFNILKQPIAIIVLSSNDRKKDTQILRDQVAKILEKNI